MSSLSIANLPAAQRNHDRQSPDDRGALYDAADEAEETEHETRMPPTVTEKEIEEVIFQIAEIGAYEDELGELKKVGKVYYALAFDWVFNRKKIPGDTYAAFYEWAESITKLAKYGK